MQLPNIGVEFLSYYGLIDDCRNNRMVDGVNSLSKPGLIGPLSVPSVKGIAEGTRPQDSLLEKFLRLTSRIGNNR